MSSILLSQILVPSDHTGTYLPYRHLFINLYYNEFPNKESSNKRFVVPLALSNQFNLKSVFYKTECHYLQSKSYNM